MQVPPHDVVPGGQVHAPATHCVPPVHACAQPPQFAGSVCVSMHLPLQIAPGGGQAHAPATHDSPGPQTVPQAPQFDGLLARSAHAPAHATLPGGQTHVPAAQTDPGRNLALQKAFDGSGLSMMPSQSLSMPSQTSGVGLQRHAGVGP
jgi:hypothetical protein